MSAVAVHAFAADEGPARALAEALQIPFGQVRAHQFPDGEVMPVVPAGPPTVLAYCSLYRPNRKLIELILAADALSRSTPANGLFRGEGLPSHLDLTEPAPDAPVEPAVRTPGALGSD